MDTADTANIDFSSLAELTTLRDFIRWGASRFVEAQLYFGHGTNNALDEAAALVLDALHLPYQLPSAYYASVLTGQEREQVLALLQRRINERKPAAYLTQKARFAGLSFYVDERVLIPRSPIAELIENRFAPWLDQIEVEHVLDLCTGSGCIAIACAYAFPQAEIDAVDLSEDALAVAAINIEKHELEDQVYAIHSDLYQQLGGKRYDLILSNPPYVSQADMQQLPQEYSFEPSMGFDGGESGLECLKRIIAEAGQYLTEQGILIVEAGCSAMVLQQAYPHYPFQWLEFERGGDGVLLLTADQVAVLDLF